MSAMLVVKTVCLRSSLRELSRPNAGAARDTSYQLCAAEVLMRRTLEVGLGVVNRAPQGVIQTQQLMKDVEVR